MKLVSAASVLCAVTALASPASAQDAEAACARSLEAGQVARKQGKLQDARREFRACSQAACPAPMRKVCGPWVQEVDRDIPSIVIAARDARGADLAGAQAYIDGKPHRVDGRPIDLDPGTHQVEVRAGAVVLRQQVVARAGEKNRAIVLKQNAAPGPARPAPRRRKRGNLPVAIAGFSVAGVGLIAGAITGGLSLSTAGDIDEMCMPNCPESFRDDYDTGLALAHVSTVSFAVAGAGAVVGVVGLLLPGPAVGGDRAQLRVGPGSLSLQGRF